MVVSLCIPACTAERSKLVVTKPPVQSCYPASLVLFRAHANPNKWVQC